MTYPYHTRTGHRPLGQQTVIRIIDVFARETLFVQVHLDIIFRNSINPMHAQNGWFLTSGCNVHVTRRIYVDTCGVNGFLDFCWQPSVDGTQALIGVPEGVSGVSDRLTRTSSVDWASVTQTSHITRTFVVE